MIVYQKLQQPIFSGVTLDSQQLARGEKKGMLEHPDERVENSKSTAKLVKNQAKKDMDTTEKPDNAPPMETEEENVILGKRSSNLQRTSYFNVFT